MKRSNVLMPVLLLFSLLAICSVRTNAQSAAPAIPAFDDIKSQPELDKAVAALDAALFDAYNRCDLEKFASFLADDIEFYHDQALGKEELVESIKRNICGSDVRRELVPGSLQAHYIKGYGAVEIGVHRFHHPKSNTPTGEGRFITLWQFKDGAWKITRAISFDHHAAAKWINAQGVGAARQQSFLWSTDLYRRPVA